MGLKMEAVTDMKAMYPAGQNCAGEWIQTGREMTQEAQTGDFCNVLTKVRAKT